MKDIKLILGGAVAIISIAGLAIAGSIENWDVSGGTASVVESAGSITISADVISGTSVAAGALTATTVTASGAVQGATLALSATQYFAIANTTQLVFIAGAVTNVIDADITSE